MSKVRTEGAEAARRKLPSLLDEAHRGTQTIITRRGKPYAAIVPVGDVRQNKGRLDIRSLRGSGKGLWGRDARLTVDRIRKEWR